MAFNRTIFVFGSGSLEVQVHEEEWGMDDLCRYAERDNPRRAYLIVSTVLGRHLPTKPSEMRASFAALAAKIPQDLPGPVLVIGMAETAICLGQGVHEELLRLTGREDIWTLHSTRQQIDHPILVQFKELHSHAVSHILYRPEIMFSEQGMPRSIVIVDDEVTTGTTVTNLAKELIACLPTTEKLVIASLTDWTRGSDWTSQIALPVEKVTLLSGNLRWMEAPPMPVINGGPANDNPEMMKDALGQMQDHHNFGRLGRRDVADDGDHLVETLKIRPGQKLRVLGTCEFTYPAFRIAELLEKRGFDVVVQSTTRSPIMQNGQLQHKLSFDDNYGTPVPNFIYNIDLEHNDRHTIICHETPDGSVDDYLIAILDAESLGFGGLD